MEFNVGFPGKVHCCIAPLQEVRQTELFSHNKHCQDDAASDIVVISHFNYNRKKVKFS